MEISHRPLGNVRPEMEINKIQLTIIPWLSKGGERRICRPIRLKIDEAK